SRCGAWAAWSGWPLPHHLRPRAPVLLPAPPVCRPWAGRRRRLADERRGRTLSHPQRRFPALVGIQPSDGVPDLDRRHPASLPALPALRRHQGPAQGQLVDALYLTIVFFLLSFSFYLFLLPHIPGRATARCGSFF